jgi:3-oxoacyl-[acyl-carrier protein] reductase
MEIIMKSGNALITGGSKGIGKATALMLAKKGFNIVLNYSNNDQAAEKAKNEIEDTGVNCYLLKFNVADFDMARSLIESTIEDIGAIDILIFNAAVRRDSLFPLMEQVDWDDTIDINLKSFYYITQPVVKSMFEQRFGRIVVMSSTSGLTGMPGQVNYSASKAGLIGAARSLAVEVGRRKITVNVITPGFIETEMVADLKERFKEIKKTIPMRRIGQPDDIANMVEFLVSDKAEYITGQVIGVNGGVFT